MTIRWLIINRTKRDGVKGWFLGTTEFRMLLKEWGLAIGRGNVTGP
jgi:hypothetical protein